MIRVVILGSGASLPTLQRHTSAVAVQREGDLYLFDCGEGTQLQWRRAGLRFAKLRAVCISHLHGDHINGLVGFLQTLSLSDRSAPLQVVGPVGLEAYLEAMRQHVGLRLAYDLDARVVDEGEAIAGDGHDIVARRLDHGTATLGYALVEDPRPGRFDVAAARRLGVPEGPLWGRLQSGEDVTLESGDAVRPGQVMGEPRPGRKVSIAVDTRPCAGARELARDADLFVCDATFTRELAREAARRGHCTAQDAARMAVEEGADRLVLTHVSARYHDPEPLREEAAAVYREAGVDPDGDPPACLVAADLMEIHV